jgi:hypothetical protein
MATTVKSHMLLSRTLLACSLAAVFAPPAYSGKTQQYAKCTPKITNLEHRKRMLGR